MSIGFVFAFTASIGFAAASFPLTELSRKFPVGRLNLMRLVFAALLLYATALMLERDTALSVFTADYAQAWLWLGLSGIISLALGDQVFFRCFSILGPRLGSVLTTFSPASALLFGIFMVGETINWVGIAGILVTIAGVIGISLGRAQRNDIPDHGHGSVLKGIALGAVASVCHGIGIVFAKKAFILQTEAGHPIGPVSATLLRVAAGAAILLLITVFSDRAFFRKNAVRFNGAEAGRFVFVTALNPSLALTLSMFSILYINVAAAQTILAMVPLFALMISFIFYREKITARAITGVIAALLGVVLLIWRDEILRSFGS